MFNHWLEHLAKDDCFAFAVIGVSKDGKQLSIHRVPNTNNEVLVKTFRDAADGVETSKTVIKDD